MAFNHFSKTFTCVTLLHNPYASKAFTYKGSFGVVPSRNFTLFEIQMLTKLNTHHDNLDFSVIIG